MASIVYSYDGFEQFDGLFDRSHRWLLTDLRQAFNNIGEHTVDVLAEHSRTFPDRRSYTESRASGRLSRGFHADVDVDTDGSLYIDVINQQQYEQLVRRGGGTIKRQPNVRRSKFGGISLRAWVKQKGLQPLTPNATLNDVAFLVARAIRQGRTPTYPGTTRRLPNRYDLRARGEILGYARQQIRSAIESFEIVPVSPQFSRTARHQRVARDPATGRFTRIPVPR